MLNQDDEPEIIYGSNFTIYLTQICTRFSYPDDEIYLFDDDIKVPLDILNIILVQLLLSLSFLETYFLSQWEGYLDHIIDKVTFSEDPTSDTTFLQASPEKYNKGLKDQNKTVYSMFVDKSLFAQVSVNIKRSMAASVYIQFSLEVAINQCVINLHNHIYIFQVNRGVNDMLHKMLPILEYGEDRTARTAKFSCLLEYRNNPPSPQHSTITPTLHHQSTLYRTAPHR